MSVDEQMLMKYYGHHTSKQFIRGKPVCYGFKNWSVCSPEGYVSRLTGTVRENMSRGLPLLCKNDMKKNKRGFYDACSSDDIQVIRWHDNSIVTFVSNCHSIAPLCQVARFSRFERKRINVAIPHAITMYNRRMGGADMAG